MSTYRLHGELVCDTKSHADSIKNTIFSVLSPNISFESVNTSVEESDGKEPLVCFDTHYAIFSTKDIVNDFILNNLKANMPTKNWIKTGWIIWHKEDPLNIPGHTRDDPEKGEIWL